MAVFVQLRHLCLGNIYNAPATIEIFKYKTKRLIQKKKNKTII